MKYLYSNYCPLRMPSCHPGSYFYSLVFTYLLIISASFAQIPTPKSSTENFLNQIFNQLSTGSPLPKSPTMPLNTFEVFQKKSPQLTIWLTYWQYQDYRYPLFVQVLNDLVVDYYLAFPSFFLHDEIHRMLIAKWGQQNYYKKSNLNAIYRWDKIANSQIAVYEASCTITCFPIFLAVQKMGVIDKSYQPLWQSFQLASMPNLKKK